MPGASTALKSRKGENDLRVAKMHIKETKRQIDLPKPLNKRGGKHTDCPFYVECLTYAVHQRWDYWSCGKCQNHLLVPIYERLQFIEQHYLPLAEIYPEFRRKYERFMESYHSTGDNGLEPMGFAQLE